MPISTLAASLHLFDVDPDRERRIDEVRSRWMQIRKALDAWPACAEFAGAADMSDLLDDFDKAVARRVIQPRQT